MIRSDRAKLPVFAIGAGVVHAIGIAILLPLLITLPGTGHNPQRPVNIEVNVNAKGPPRPIVPDVASMHYAADDATSALPAADDATFALPAAGGRPLVDVSPDASPEDGLQAPPLSGKPAASAAPAKKVKPKAGAKSFRPASKTARAPQQKKSILARGKPLFKGTGGRTSVKTPAQGSWTSLLNASPSAADAR